MIRIPKKKFLIVLGAIVIITTLAAKIIEITHWKDLNWEVTGISPFFGPLVLVWAFAYMAVLFFHKVRAPSLWVMGVAGLIYGAIATWMVTI